MPRVKQQHEKNIIIPLPLLTILLLTGTKTKCRLQNLTYRIRGKPEHLTLLGHKQQTWIDTQRPWGTTGNRSFLRFREPS